MKKSIAITGLFLALLISIAYAKAPFPDIQNSKYKEDILYLYEKGVVRGYEDGLFHPEDTITRAELMKILIGLKAPKETIEGKKNCFQDVLDEWFSPYICYAKEQKIVSGYPDGRFRPEQNVKMAEAFKMAIGTFGFVLQSPQTNKPWYTPYVEFIHVNNIFSKYAYLAARAILREETAFLTHQISLIKEGKKPLSAQRNNRSAGCGKIPPTITPSSSIVNDLRRNYITVIPRNYSKETPIKLVFAFHGRTNSNTMVRGYYGVEEASQGKAIFIYPSGIRNERGYSWSNSGDPPDRLRDFALFDQLLKEFSEKYCIDIDNIYVVAHSLGAWFVNSLACARGDVIRAIGTIGGGTTIGKCAGPVATIIWHNPKDNLVSFSQGEMARNQLKNQNQCSDKIVPVEPRAANCVAYQGCGDYAPLVWCPHTINYAHWDGSYYPHTWPEFAGREIWKFFENLPE